MPYTIARECIYMFSGAGGEWVECRAQDAAAPLLDRESTVAPTWHGGVAH